MSRASRPLDGVRVVELAVWVAGPGAGGVLAEWGADVIKIEPPDGDPMRRLFALIAGHGQVQSPPFDLDNRGKRSVVLDLRSEEGRVDAQRVIADADVFITNLRPDAVDRLGLGPRSLLADNPRLIYGSVTGYGRDGPDAGRAGYDVGAFWARSGQARTLVPSDQAPPSIRSGTGDHVTAMDLVAGVCAALFQREATGQGQLVETSLLRAGIYCMGWDLGIQLRFDKMTPTVPRTEAMNPLVNCYEAADGRWFWLLGLEADRHWPGLVRALGDADLAADERFDTSRGRRKQASELIVILDALFAQRDRDEWIARFDAEDVWWAPVHELADVLADEQVIAAGGIVDVPDGEGAAAHRAIATPIDFGGVPITPVGGVPGLGEHTTDILGPH